MKIIILASSGFILQIEKSENIQKLDLAKKMSTAKYDEDQPKPPKKSQQLRLIRRLSKCKKVR